MDKSCLYGFRLKFYIPKNQLIDYEGEYFDINISENKKMLRLTAESDGALKDSDCFIIKGTNFSKEEAHSLGTRAKNTLMLCGLKLDMGFNVGKDEASFFIGKEVKDEILALGYRVIDDIHGLNIFPEDMPTKIFSSKSIVKTYPSFNNIIYNLKELFLINYDLSDNQTLALELFNLSYFEESNRSKFLTLFTAVECLSHPRGESIRKSCEKIIKKYLELEYLTQFEIFYKIRSSLIHEGKVPTGFNLVSQLPRLRSLISKLFIRMISE